MVTEDRFELAPFYDIVNISVYQESYDNGLAMAIDNEFVLEELTAYIFSEFCLELGINKKLFATEFLRVSTVITRALESEETLTLVIEHQKNDFFSLYKNDVLEKTERLTAVVQESIKVDVR